jgi:hypothetical protein
MNILLNADRFYEGRGNMKDFRELKVWEKSHRLALKVYSATTKFPKEELYGLLHPKAKNRPLNLNRLLLTAES